MNTNINKDVFSNDFSWWHYYRLHWKSGIVRMYYRFYLSAVYYFKSTRAFNPLFLSMPSELMPEILAKFGAKIGHGTTVMPPLYVHNLRKHKFEHFANLTIGQGCYLGPELFIDLKNEIKIAENVTLSMRVSLITHMDVGNSPLRLNDFPPQNRPIIIHKGAYIGAGATVLMGVEIGEMAVIGAGCVVSKDVPPCSVVVGKNNRVLRRVN